MQNNKNSISYDSAAIAKELFAIMRTLDNKGIDLLIIEGISEDFEGLAIMNRLRKAASYIVI